MSLDFNYGHAVDARMYAYLLDNGMTAEEYLAFTNKSLRHHSIIGSDYYSSNEHRIAADGSSRSSGEVLGYGEIAREYYNRYGLPIMHTETNMRGGSGGADQVDWLWRQWSSLMHIRNARIPTVGFTWYSLTDQSDWDTWLREENGHINPVGLLDLDRRMRPVGEAYKQLIAEWEYVLPARSVCLVVPVVMPSEYRERFAERRRNWLRRYHRNKQAPVQDPAIICSSGGKEL